MRTLTCLILLSLLSAEANASLACARVFDENIISSIASSKYKNYDPSNIDEQIKVLENGELNKIRHANAKKTHLPYFEDYILDALDRLIKVKVRRNNPNISARVEELGIEAFKRLSNKELTYEWVIEFSYQAMAIFGNEPTPVSYRNMNRILRSFPYDIMIPTFAELDFKHFIKIEGMEFTFLGMKEKNEFVDGNEVAFTPEQFSNHDFLHYYLTQKNDVILNPRHTHYKTWLKLHNEIKNRISKLPENRRVFSEYIYFFVLHEEFGMRTRFVQKYLGEGSLSRFASQVLDFETITNHFNGKAFAGNVLRSELYNRTTRPHDFITAFPEKTNPQEILLVGIGDFIKILKEIELTPAN